MIRIIVADDHQVVRQGLRALLEETGDMVVIGEAADGQEAVHLVDRLLPDIVVIDIGMPTMNGIQATAHIRTRYAATQVVILSMYDDETLVWQALKQGARGYVLKRAAADELLMAVRAASRGEAFLSPAVAALVLDDFLARAGQVNDANLFDRLTPRERQTLQLIAEGRTNRQIAEQLQIAVKTVEKHRTSLMAKLQVHDLAGLVKTAVRHRLVMIDE